MRVFHCDACGHLLFFENVLCVRCGKQVAFVPALRDMVSLEPAEGEAEGARPRRYRLCENYTKAGVCNWALGEQERGPLCRSCALTRTIPNLSVLGNDRRWYKLEVAKRRLVYTLDGLNLPIVSRADDPQRGLVFDLLEDTPGTSGTYGTSGTSGTPSTPATTTGHLNGVITVNLAEADDAERVKRRLLLNEPYRTLLGHFRHESGHYYWGLLIERSPHLTAFRGLFGDERQGYDRALSRHYEGGTPGLDWQASFVSAYASVHPWEDWAETWAHYLHMVDTLETAAACGLSVAPLRRDEPTLTEVPAFGAGSGVAFERVLQAWTVVTYVMNNLNRSLGTDDAYPFVLSPRSQEKLRFVHERVCDGRVL